MTDFKALEEHVFPQLEGAGMSPAHMQLFRPISEIADNPVKLVIRDRREACLGILQWSPPAAVQAVANAVRLAEAARRRLGEDLGSVVLAATLEGEFQSRTFALYPWMGVLSDRRIVSRLHNWRYAGPLLKWLRNVHETTHSRLPEAEYDARVMAPLEQLAGEVGLVAASRDAVEVALAAVQSGDFQPRIGPVHNDLWRGNVLLPQAGSGPRPDRWPFFLIDWGASTLAGFPLWDLLRILRSLRVPNRVAARVLRQHCKGLGMTLDEGRHSLMLALADLGLYRNEFPLELYLNSVETYQAYYSELAE
ncbi:MAG: phosphotransferase [Myxococcota bacterium]|nr:phosphotransferase [Myxococcota bacterium]